MTHPHTQLCNAAINALWLRFSHQPVKVFDNQAKYSKGGKRRAMPGLGDGTADLVLCVAGRFVMLDAKTGRAQLSRDRIVQTGSSRYRHIKGQRTVQAEVRDADGIYEVFRSPEQAIAIVADILMEDTKWNCG